MKTRVFTHITYASRDMPDDVLRETAIRHAEEYGGKGPRGGRYEIIEVIDTQFGYPIGPNYFGELFSKGCKIKFVGMYVRPEHAE